MKELSKTENKLLTLSNDIADYPPTNLTMHEWQTLIVLSSIVNSKERPIFGIDDIKEIAEERGLATKAEQNQLLNELIRKQNQYELTYDDFFSYYDGDTPLSRKTKKDILNAMESISGKTVVTANNEKVFASFAWFDWIINDKKNKKITYSLGQVSKTLLMGLDKNFLQMMARLSIKEARKYDIPIFVHLKSRLHNKKEAFSWTESLPEFQKRFGHDKIPSYKAWKDYYRRVLKSAEAYSLRSGDIACKFEGKATRGRKITHVYCKVWRTGNIYHLKSGRVEQQLKEKQKGWKVLEKKMTPQQYEGYQYLKSLEVNYVFLLEECISHKCLKQEVIIGYEDVFLKLLWKRFSTYTKAEKKGGAFVTWWRRGRLTEGDHYWATVEALSQAKKSITTEEADERVRMLEFSHIDYDKSKKQKETNKKSSKSNIEKTNPISKVAITAPSKTATFNYETFRNENPKEVASIKTDLVNRLKHIYQNDEKIGEDLDPQMQREIKKKVEDMLPQHCERWWKDHKRSLENK